MAGTAYVTLVASLPALGPMLAARQPPINPDRFRARLSMLSAGDLATLVTVHTQGTKLRIHPADTDPQQ